MESSASFMLPRWRQMMRVSAWWPRTVEGSMVPEPSPWRMKLEKLQVRRISAVLWIGKIYGETASDALITRRSQVQILPPRPKLIPWPAKTGRGFLLTDI